MKRLLLTAALMLCAVSAQAQTMMRAQQAWRAMDFKVGIGHQWGADERVVFRNSTAKPVAFGRLELGTWNRLALDGEIGRRIDIGNQWNARAAVTFKLK